MRPPRLRTGETGERRATWFEVFFDLVFVVVIAQLAGGLAADPAFTGIGRFAGLFVPLWWSWVLFTYYSDRFDTDDLAHRLLMLGGMLAVAATTVNLRSAGHGRDAGFVAAYLCVRAMPVVFYARAARHEPLARQVTLGLGAGSAVAAMVWLASLAVTPPGRYWMWAAAVTIELSLPLLTRPLQQQLPPHRSHIPERFGLFTIIVLGQAVIDVVTAAAATRWAASSTAVAALGILLAGGLWWLYFDFLPTETIGQGFGPQQVYTYSHAPLLAGVVAVGAGTRLAIAHAGAPHLSSPALATLCGGLAAYALASWAIQLTGRRSWPDRASTGRLALAALAVATGFLGRWIPPPAVVGLLASGCAGQIILELSAGQGQQRQRHVHDAALRSHAQQKASQLRASRPIPGSRAEASR